ncbi:MAG: carbonic anhydrase [Candidatus ainarchaeum sp.]|nr:carbonic anhydrase [Candidatus ainarchaeum sp.]
MNGEEALAKLLEGNKRFVAGTPEAKDFAARREELKQGQHPIATVVACSDSRVVPEYIFDVGLGEIFKVESAGNVLDRIGLGSVEYGVAHLHTPLLVVLGHEKCGAVTAAYDGHAEGNIAAIVKKLAPAVKKAKKGGDKAAEVEQAAAINVKKVMGKLRKLPPVKAALESGALKIVGMRYSLGGAVEIIVKK